jgi:hypothetical protein
MPSNAGKVEARRDQRTRQAAAPTGLGAAAAREISAVVNPLLASLLLGSSSCTPAASRPPVTDSGAEPATTLLAAETSRPAPSAAHPDRTAMITDALTNRVVRAAIDALQHGDRAAWSALFEPEAKLYDDGSPRSLEKFTRDALGHERFTSIDRVSEGGLEVVGAFHSDRWGDFKTYFRFQLTATGKIKRLDIGQAR